MRLLGFIKFFNYEKGYGFIFTNRFGIEQNQNGLEEKNNGSIELYFKYKDVEYTWTELPRSRDFVSFEYDLPHKDSIIGRVRHIKKISYLEEEYSLALSYLYNYTTIECGNNSIRLVPYFFGHAFLRNKQSVFDFLLDNAKISIPDISNIVLELSIYRGLSNLFFNRKKTD